MPRFSPPSQFAIDFPIFLQRKVWATVEVVSTDELEFVDNAPTDA
jgi:hypothetical protein